MISKDPQPREALKYFMAKRGYKYMGEGMYAMVFESNQGYIVKVYGIGREETNDVENFDPLVFYYFCKKMNSKFLPKFGTARKLKIGDVNYILITTEKLSHKPTDPNILEHTEDLMYYPLQDAIDQNVDIRKLVEKHGIDTFKGLHEVVEKVCKAGDCEDLSNPYGENIMYRGNTIVINDPWAYT
jgi:hypothetical protein